MSQAGKHANLGGVSGRQPSSSSTACVEALGGFRIASSDTIYPALSAGLDRRRRNEARDILILTFLLIEARRYEHAGCANRIHCR
jgi:hypothetical protein